MSLLDVDQLQVRFATPDGVVQAVNGVSFTLEPGQALGIVGESGSGKSQTALAIPGLLAANARVSGRIHFEGADLLQARPATLSRVRGARIGMVFQDPMTCLNPYLTLRRQMTEVLIRHRGLSETAAAAECLRLLDAVRLPEAARRLQAYPHQLSGGQRQRVMLAMTLLCRPPLLICDEPTTALDVTVQAQVLDLLAELRREMGMAIILITHDLGVVAELCEQTLVMYAGQVMEYGPTRRLLENPRHPYTRGLLQSRPRLDQPLDQPLTAIPGQPPDLVDLPPGCPFAPRCPQVIPLCHGQRPLPTREQGVVQACHLLV
jgi:oligopeptide transport system ATP-binding protein